MAQDWIVAVLVGLAALYSVWYLLPAAARERLGRYHRALGSSPGCSTSCSSCAKCPGAAAPGSVRPAAGEEHPVTFDRQP
ncbi:hypothetical protein LHU53_01680 [Rhodoferax sp. U2-2l]|uniref:hypothetical protein n=1 Tax=Rhodoferax sp. U2-2l TaxID=2884000 RepID=UPI001D09EDE4|nr:hypothetical protein [Rhodoferax sp. U2-2l]MCB8745611.1 hypothetical protein [Rhodoferax sp. U2-2l]